MDIDAGKLNKRIQIVRVEQIRDSDGYYTGKKTVIREPWAQFSQTSGTEIVKNGAEFGEVKARFLIRWSQTKISRKDLVRYAGNDYQIEYINPYGDSREYLELWCTRTTLGG